MKKNVIIGLIVLLLVAAGSFYGGNFYGSRSRSNPSNFSRDMSQGKNNMTANARRGGGQAGGGFINGSLLSQDDQSLTIKSLDGGSKIVFLSSSTQIMKMASSSKDQLVVGDALMIVGTNNSDGSVAAQSVQVRPGGEFGPNGKK